LSTTNSGFVVNDKAALVGSATVAANAVVALSDQAANVEAAANTANAGNAGSVRLDSVNVNLATAGYAKNAGVYLSLTGTTAITVSLLALAAATGVTVAGDTSFATVNQLVFLNTGAVDLVVSPGASNGFGVQLGCTSPTLTVAAGSSVTIQSVAGLATSSGAKNITVTPTSGGSMGLCVGGA